MKFDIVVPQEQHIRRLLESDFSCDIILSDGGHDVISRRKVQSPS